MRRRCRRSCAADRLGRLDVLIDNHRKEREEHARQAYIQRQASKLLDVTMKEFTPVATSCHLFGEASTIYMVKRNDNEGKEGRFSLVRDGA